MRVKLIITNAEEALMSDSVNQIAKIKLKVGSMELEYEGDPDFLTGGIEALLETMGGLVSKVPDATEPPALSAELPAVNGKENGAPAAKGHFTFSTDTIAAHLEAKSGPELVICAMAELEFVQAKASSTRTDILNEMKSATTYYKETMRNNLTGTLSRLVKDKRINQIAKDTYALSAGERKQLEAKVADIG